MIYTLSTAYGMNMATNDIGVVVRTLEALTCDYCLDEIKLDKTPTDEEYIDILLNTVCGAEVIFNKFSKIPALQWSCEDHGDFYQIKLDYITPFNLYHSVSNVVTKNQFNHLLDLKSFLQYEIKSMKQAMAEKVL